ncbi:hypothetical protein Fcan01_02390 [Folsomia candida]|uniref:CUB domain-containing protein n=1 Tax=Folsomia candida TaxID=158441 RepID=A0A226F1X0_FOLCA|nr:hypothetical protein Fcan01_02390 [Folsomia candida]
MILGRDFFGEIIVAQKKHRLATLYPSQDTMRTDFYSIVLTSTLVLVVNCFNLDRELQNFDQSLLETKSNERSSKLFPLFSVLIRNVQCLPEASENVAGTCSTNSQCRNSGGVASGACANGFGVCCVVTYSCEDSARQNNSNFRNRDYPSGFNPTGLEVCNLRIQKPSSNVCQIRLDFTNMQLAAADPITGQCMNDRLSINGVSGTVPSNLCGDLSQQHMYLDYGSSDRITLSVITDGGGVVQARQWNVRLTYLECNSLSRGEVRMLGYPMNAHLADLDYTVCVRSEDGAGSIVWSPCQGEPIASAFLMSGAPLTDPTMGTPGASGACSADYVLIMTDDPQATPTKLDDRYCGNALAAMMPPFLVRSIAKPFIMRVRTDSLEDAADMTNTGFCLAFRQEPPRPQAG